MSLLSLTTLIDRRVSSHVLQGLPQTQEYSPSITYDLLTNFYEDVFPTNVQIGA